MSAVLQCTAEVPSGVQATILSATPGRVGYNLLRRLIFVLGKDYGIAGQWQYQGYLKAIPARDIGREKYVEHLQVEGSVYKILPPTTVNTSDSQTIIDGDGSTVCSAIALGGATSGILTNGVLKSNAGNGSFAPLAAGVWGTQFIFASSMRTEDGPSWWRSNGQRFYDLTIGATYAEFSVAQNSYSCFGKPGWWYGASGFARLYKVTVELISETRYRVTWVNTLNRVPLSGLPRWSEQTVLAPVIEYGNTYSIVGNQVPMSVQRPTFVDRLLYAVQAPQQSSENVLQKAMDQYRVVHSNNVENAAQLAAGVQQLLPLSAAMHAFEAMALARTRPLDSAVHASKCTADLYLWWRYVAQTTFNDIVDWRLAVTRGLEKFNKMMDSPRRLRAKEDFSVELAGIRLQVRVAELLSVSPYPWMHTFNRMLALGFEPGLGQTWDLIPFSFVVDWFTSFSGILRAVDWYFYQALLGINVRVSSRKTKYEGQFYEDGWSGNLNVSYYERVPSNRRPSLKELLPIPRSVPIANWVPAAAALVIAR